MARIDASSLKNWNDGDTMHESDYEQEREIIRTAVNDNDDRVRVLENANLGILSRIRSGIAFPTLPTPVAGDKFYRTDLDTEYTYDTDWIPTATQDWVKSFGLGGNAQDISNTDLNNLDATGFYRGSNLTNRCSFPGGNTIWQFLINIKHDSLYKKQIAFDFDTGQMATRVLMNGTWGAWTKLATTTQEDWLPLVFQNGWVPAGSGDAAPKYMKDDFGFVHLKGTLWGGGGAVLSDWTIITSLPAGYIPSERIRLASINTDETNTKACYIVVEADGLVKIKNVSYAGKLELNVPPFRV